MIQSTHTAFRYAGTASSCSQKCRGRHSRCFMTCKNVQPVNTKLHTLTFALHNISRIWQYELKKKKNNKRYKRRSSDDYVLPRRLVTRSTREAARPQRIAKDSYKVEMTLRQTAWRRWRVFPKQKATALGARISTMAATVASTNRAFTNE